MVLLLQVAAANVAMWVALTGLHRPLAWWLEVTVMERSWWLATTVVAGAAAYFVVLLVLGLRPAKLALRRH